ncbi:MAG: tetratricopeptide repeat protein [Verrucomicrobiota bacterium]|nr:tetratricopeptide repeat protein [Verrucomicrobiota bacterium]
MATRGRNLKSARARKVSIAPTDFWRPILAAIGLVAAVFAVYYPAWRGGFLWEDLIHAETNPLLTASDGWRQIWFSFDSPVQYFPLTHSVFRLEKAFWGTSLLAHHLVNIGVHAASALILWRLLRRLAVPAAWLGAALFALHPVQVESVAQISELKNVLMGLFFFASLFFWVRYCEQKRALWWTVSFVCYVLALAAKTNASVLPAALVLILWWRQERVGWRWMAEIAPFAALSIGAGFVAILWERTSNTTSLYVMKADVIERGLIASRDIFFYLGKLLWPVHLSFNYPAWNISRTHPTDYLWLVALVATAAVIFFAWRRLGRGPEVASSFFVVALLPFLGFVNFYPFRYSYVDDHYQYLASIGPLSLVAAAFSRMGRNLRVAAAACVLGLLAFLTWRHAHAYESGAALWEDTIKENPQSYLAENNFGTTLLDEGDPRAALPHLQRAYQLAPANFESAHNMGVCLMNLQRLTDALPYLEQAVKIDGRDANARRDLGRALLQLGRADEAAEDVEQLLALKPGDAKAHTLLAAIRTQQARPEEAMTHLRTALSLAPDDAEAMTQLANLYLQTQKEDAAAALLRKILEVRSDDADALKNYAWLLATASEANLRDGTRAVALAEKAQLKAPGNPFIQATLAAAYAEAGRFNEARAVAQNALRFAEANNLSGLAALLNKEIALFENRRPMREQH